MRGNVSASLLSFLSFMNQKGGTEELKKDIGIMILMVFLAAFLIFVVLSLDIPSSFENEKLSTSRAYLLDAIESVCTGEQRYIVIPMPIYRPANTDWLIFIDKTGEMFLRLYKFDLPKSIKLDTPLDPSLYPCFDYVPDCLKLNGDSHIVIADETKSSPCSRVPVLNDHWYQITVYNDDGHVKFKAEKLDD